MSRSWLQRATDQARALSLWQWLLVLFVILPGVPFVVATLVIAIGIYWPTDESRFAFPNIAPATKTLTIAAHGLRDSPSSWAQRLADQLNQSSTNTNLPAQHFALDWSNDASNSFRCSVNGRRIGNALGAQVAKLPNLQRLHLIGHSCGSFVVYGICEAIREARPTAAPKIHSSYLDPVSVYGGFFWDWGTKNFGRCADFADAYIDTEDQVPGSNVPLTNAHTFDVTAARKANKFEGHPHNWPAVIYPQLLAKGWMNDQPIERLSADFPRGKHTVISKPIDGILANLN